MGDPYRSRLLGQKLACIEMAGLQVQPQLFLRIFLRLRLSEALLEFLRILSYRHLGIPVADPFLLFNIVHIRQTCGL